VLIICTCSASEAVTVSDFDVILCFKNKHNPVIHLSFRDELNKLQPVPRVLYVLKGP